MTRKFALSLGLVVLAFSFQLSAFSWAQPQGVFRREPVVVKVFHSPSCKSCIKVIHDILPSIVQKYGAKIQWQYYDLTEMENYKKFLQLERHAGKPLTTPAILIGRHILVGMTEVADSLEADIEAELKSASPPLLLPETNIDFMGRFKTLGLMTVMGAGLVDGFNPCAFTVIVFFVSFLTVMGYRRREMALIGFVYVLAVFLTYLALGLGFFKALYSLKLFYLVSKIIYLAIGGLSLFLGCLATNDFFRYKKTGKTDEMALQLPIVIKNRIHAIVGNYYRKDKHSQTKAMFSLVMSAWIVGFMISLLEAVCTGQLYLPTIVFVLKEEALRVKALFYLFIYNLMFILPLIVVLVLALMGFSSAQFEAVTRRHFGLIKVLMAAVFFGLGVVLWLGT